MKSTVYVPDGLWAKAKELAPEGSNPSQLVRTALAEWVEAIAPRQLETFEAPVDDEVLFDDLINLGERLRRQAQGVYETGYRAGVKAADALEWSDFESLSEASFDVGLWAEPMRERASYLLAEFEDPERARLAIAAELRAFAALREPLGAIVDPTASLHPTGVFLDGFGRALHDLWEWAMSPPRVSKSVSADGVFEEGGHVLHRELGIGVVEAMRSRSDGGLVMTARFRGGKRRRLHGSSADVVALPTVMEAKVQRLGVEKVFAELSADKASRQNELAHAVRRFLDEYRGPKSSSE